METPVVVPPPVAPVPAAPPAASVALVAAAPASVALVPAVSVSVTLVVTALLVSLAPVALTTDKVWFWAPTSVAASVALVAGPAVAFPAVAFAAIGGPLTMGLPL